MANRNNKAAIVPVTSTDTAPVALQSGDLQAIPSTAIAAVRDAIVLCAPHVIDAKDAVAKVAADNKLATGAASETDVTTRKGMYINLAEISHKAQYTQAHIDAGAEAAKTAYAASRNAEMTPEQVRTLNTFAGECKRIMHPMVREHVKGAYMTCESLWAAEVAAAKADPENAATPLKDAWKKCEFAVKNNNGLLGSYMHKDANVRNMALTGDVHGLAARVIATAKANPVANAKAVERAASILAGVLENFPDDEFRALIAQVAAIDADKLRAFAKVRDAKALATNTLVPTRVAPRAAATPSATPPVTAAAAHAATEDLLDAMEMKKQNGELKAMLAAIVAKLA